MSDSGYFGTPCSLAMYNLCPLAAEAGDAPFEASEWERGFYDETRDRKETRKNESIN